MSPRSPKASRLPVALFAAAALASAQEVEVLPVAVGPGPLLVFESRSEEGVPRRYNVVTLDHAGEAGRAQEFLRYDGNLTVHRRLDLGHLLVGMHQADRGLWVIDLRRGERRPIAARPHVVLGVRGGDVLFCENEDGAGRLMAQPWTRDGAPRALGDSVLFELHVEGDIALGVEPESRRVHCVDLVHGEDRALGVVPGYDVRFAVSPDGRHFVTGSMDLDGGAVRVHDLRTGELVTEWTGIRLSLPFDSSFSPRMEVAWDGPERVVFSESRGVGADPAMTIVTRDVATGETVAERRYHNLYHDLPQNDRLLVRHLGGSWPLGEQGRFRRGGFELEGARLFLPGGSEPVAECDGSVQFGGHILLTPDGRFAIVRRDRGEWIVDVIEAGDGARRRVFDGWIAEPHWLPGAP